MKKEKQLRRLLFRKEQSRSIRNYTRTLFGYLTAVQLSWLLVAGTLFALVSLMGERSSDELFTRVCMHLTVNSSKPLVCPFSASLSPSSSSSSSSSSISATLNSATSILAAFSPVVSFSNNNNNKNSAVLANSISSLNEIYLRKLARKQAIAAKQHQQQQQQQQQRHKQQQQLSKTLPLSLTPGDMHIMDDDDIWMDLDSLSSSSSGVNQSSLSAAAAGASSSKSNTPPALVNIKSMQDMYMLLICCSIVSFFVSILIPFVLIRANNTRQHAVAPSHTHDQQHQQLTVDSNNNNKLIISISSTNLNVTTASSSTVLATHAAAAAAATTTTNTHSHQMAEGDEDTAAVPLAMLHFRIPMVFLQGFIRTMLFAEINKVSFVLLLCNLFFVLQFIFNSLVFCVCAVVHRLSERQQASQQDDRLLRPQLAPQRPSHRSSCHRVQSAAKCKCIHTY